MATDQTVETSDKLWSEECANADDTPEDLKVYEFTNGKRFEAAETLYDTPAP